MLDTMQVRSTIARCAVFAMLSTCATGYAGATLAHDECLDRQDRFDARRSDPRYGKLQQAVDSFRAEHQKADGFSGVSMHVSLSPSGQTFDVASGSTSFHKGKPICPNTLFQIGSITKSFTAVLILQLEAAGVLTALRAGIALDSLRRPIHGPRELGLPADAALPGRV